MAFVVCTMNSVCQLIGNRTIRWGGTQGVIVVSELRLESRLGPVWSKLVAHLKDSDHTLGAVGSHGRLWKRGVAGRPVRSLIDHCVSCRQGRQCEEHRCEMGSESTVNRQVWP